MQYLIVVAHPDDEVLGAGATIHKLEEQGHHVAVAIMSSNAEARKDLSSSLVKDEEKAMEIMGVEKVYHADFPNIKLNIVPHLDLVQFIERCIKDWKAEAIITHHPSDVNIDHQETSKASVAACRFFQRTADIPDLQLLAYMEVPSSTDWALDSSKSKFDPNMFIEVGENGINTKIKALSSYLGVMRPYPHPRSHEAIKGLAVYRGAQSGCNYAEAFEIAFYRG